MNTAVFRNHGEGWHSYGARVRLKTGEVLMRLGFSSAAQALAWIDEIEKAEREGRPLWEKYNTDAP